MESVIVISESKINLHDLLAGRESSCPVPSEASDVIVCPIGVGDEHLTIQFTKDSRKKERVLRNVSSK